MMVKKLYILFFVFALCSQVSVGQITFTAEPANQETITTNTCSGKTIFHVTGGYSGIYIKANGSNLIDNTPVGYTVDKGSLGTTKWSNTFFTDKPGYFMVTVVGSVIKVEFSTNEPSCGPALTSATISATAFCSGNATLTANYLFTPKIGVGDIVSIKWKKNGTLISEGTSTTLSVDDNTATYTYEVFLNGNSMGTSSSFTFTIPDPRIEVTASALSIVKKVEQIEAATITLTPHLLDVCPGVDEGFSWTQADASHAFSISDPDNGVYTLTFDASNNLPEGTYNTSVTFTNGVYSKTVDIVANLVSYPKTYIIKRCTSNCNWADYTTWDNFPVTTTNDGDISLILNSGDYYKYVLPPDVTVACRNFTLTSSAGDYCNWEFKTYGSIIASDAINIGTTSKRLAGNNSFMTECSSFMRASAINIYRKQSLTELKGTYLAENLLIDHTEGGNLSVNECTFIKANDATVQIAGGSMQFNMNGHLISDNISINNPTTYVNMDGIMTLGNLAGGTKIIAGKNATVNMCVNHTQNGDKMGMFVGNILYNYGDFATEHGWGESSNPKDQGDINDNEYVNNNKGTYGFTSDDINNVKLYKAYSTYGDCINERGMATLLPIELTIFEVKGEKNIITFNWQTKTETNNDYFKIEYSTNGKDWKEVGRENGQGTTSEMTSYKAVFENNLPNMFVYFRLTQVDFDGNTSSSKVIVLDNTTGQSKFKILQNGPLNIQYNSQGKRVIEK